MAKRRDHRVTAADIVRFFDKYIYIPEGRWVGQRLVLDPWQRAEIERIYDNPDGPTRRSILSMGRKNAKSTLAAAYCWHTWRGRLPSAAPTVSSTAPHCRVTRHR
jgi:phage terminase large subunit-like protein